VCKQEAVVVRFLGILLLVISVGLVGLDAAAYFKDGSQLNFTTVEGLWNLAGGHRVFGLRATLVSALGSFGDLIVGLPAIALTCSLGLVLVWAAQRATSETE
jgi:hypothetical protein